jgi:ATP-dependent Lon protease
MEIIYLGGYTEEDKLHISRMYLIPRQESEHGLPKDYLKLTEPALRRIITEYTREAGVRTLERQIGTIARKVAAKLAVAAVKDESTQPKEIGVEDLRESLGLPRFRPDGSFRLSRPGVVTGVAWTDSGGDVLFIEALLLHGGKGQLTLTGQLGNVMQESARAAVSHIRQQAGALGIDPGFMSQYDLHVHVPAGAIPKDGPSAGITMATAIVSALRNQKVRADVAMTGEITLSGLVLPVGGIREKSLAARRMGITTFVLPEQNMMDVEDLPAEVKKGMTFVPVRTLEEVLAIALPAVIDKAAADLTSPPPDAPPDPGERAASSE